MNHDGMVFQAGAGEASFSAASVIGRWPAAIRRALASGKSAANWSWNLLCWMYRSLPPSAKATGGASVGPRVLPGNLPDRPTAVSPASGANAATYTSALTLLAPVAAALITEPPYEWPTSTTGPLTLFSTAATEAASVLTLRSGLAAPITV